MKKIGKSRLLKVTYVHPDCSHHYISNISIKMGTSPLDNWKPSPRGFPRPFKMPRYRRPSFPPPRWPRAPQIEVAFYQQVTDADLDDLVERLNEMQLVELRTITVERRMKSTTANRHNLANKVLNSIRKFLPISSSIQAAPINISNPKMQAPHYVLEVIPTGDKPTQENVIDQVTNPEGQTGQGSHSNNMDHVSQGSKRSKKSTRRKLRRVLSPQVQVNDQQDGSNDPKALPELCKGVSQISIGSKSKSSDTESNSGSSAASTTDLEDDTESFDDNYSEPGLSSETLPSFTSTFTVMTPEESSAELLEFPHQANYHGNGPAHPAAFYQPPPIDIPAKLPMDDETLDEVLQMTLEEIGWTGPPLLKGPFVYCHHPTFTVDPFIKAASDHLAPAFAGYEAEGTIPFEAHLANVQDSATREADFYALPSDVEPSTNLSENFPFFEMPQDYMYTGHNGDINIVPYSDHLSDPQGMMLPFAIMSQEQSLEAIFNENYYPIDPSPPFSDYASSSSYVLAPISTEPQSDILSGDLQWNLAGYSAPLVVQETFVPPEPPHNKSFERFIQSILKPIRNACKRVSSSIDPESMLQYLA
jgi:hypothetical protein